MPAPLKVGLNICWVEAAHLSEYAQLAESLGYKSLWSGEHVCLSAEPNWWKLFPGAEAMGDAFTEDMVPFTPDSMSPDPMVVLAQLWTGNDWKLRGKRMNEMIRALRVLFEQERPEFHGELFDFGPMGFQPKPRQRPMPIHLGGGTAPAMRRAGRLGNRWYGSPEAIPQVREELKQAGRENAPFEFSTITLQGPIPRNSCRPWRTWVSIESSSRRARTHHCRVKEVSGPPIRRARARSLNSRPSSATSRKRLASPRWSWTQASPGARAPKSWRHASEPIPTGRSPSRLRPGRSATSPRSKIPRRSLAAL